MKTNKRLAKQLFISCFALLLPLLATAQGVVEVDGMWYNLNAEIREAEVTSSGGTKYSGDITIPATVTYEDVTYSVTSIGGYAFRDCSSLTSITIPEGVTSIGNGAFHACSSLTAITIPEGVTSIGGGAFRNCSSLTAITIPEGVTSIGNSAFSGCSSLTAITIPEGVTSIGNSVFVGCSSLTAITIPEGVTSIGNSVFEGCRSLTSITIPEGVTSIGDGAFRACSSLTSINLPEGVTSIRGYAFRDCSSLTSINLPDGVTSIGNYAFYNCTSLTSINISKSVTSIGWEAFNNCTHLTSITLPEGVKSIGERTFYYCSSLTAINIPKSVTSIGSSAFEGCSCLTAITLPEGVTSIGNYVFSACYFTHENFINNSTCTSSDNWGAILCDKEYDGILVQEEKVILCRPSVTSATIPEGVTSIGWNAFYGCTNLKELTLGKGLKKIPAGAFSTCTALEKITIHATQPPAADGYIFSDATYENATLYVPQGSIAKYQVMTGWSGFYNMSEIEGSTPDYLTLRQADNGEVGIAVDLGRTYKVRITPSTGWKIHSVTFDGKDMTAQLAADNTFTTPTINGSAVLNVAYVKEGSAIAAATASRIKVQGHQGIISIAGATAGEAIGLYTTSGTLVATATAEGDTTHLTVPTGQVYIVKVADTVVKIGM